MTDRYEKIRKALATGPTKGPWGLRELPRDMQRDGYKFSISRGGLGWWIAKVTHGADGGSGVANAAYIAACDPDTLRALLEERDQLAADLEAAREDAERWRHARNLLTVDDIEGAQGAFDSFGGLVSEDECKRADAAIDRARGKGGKEDSND